MMRSCIAALVVGAAVLAGPLSATAAPLPAVPAVEAPSLAEPAQYPRSPSFRRCMRAKYGPRYFARVPRAVRWHMAQACMA